MAEDIRDKAYLTHTDIIALNFIKDSGCYLYRRHYRNGLRSHIMEVLDAAQVQLETHGRVVKGVRLFPKAIPLKMLRIFRTRLGSIRQALNEIVKLRVIETFLAKDQFAGSSEFIVDYTAPNGPDMLLCGLQEYVQGRKLDPWLLKSGGIYQVYPDKNARAQSVFAAQLRKSAQRFVAGIIAMIQKSGYIPDIAGQRNLLVTRMGHIRLVDINNVSRINFDAKIYIDDKGYPVCDKSVEALALIDRYLCDNRNCKGQLLFQMFLDPGRMREVGALDDVFHRSLEKEAKLAL
ncbi:MAG: hypothetical protein GY697_17310 [Desulfobacterales bacterium]|nr:hypothetical protein [Desulfobacterales bacterium]